jgi:hypothetical protein
MGMKKIKNRNESYPVDHWFNYKSRVEKELKALTKTTHITDWQSEQGQAMLASLQMKDLRDGTHLDLRKLD